LDFRESDNAKALAKEFHARWSELSYADMVRLRFNNLRERARQSGRDPSTTMWDADEEAHLASYRMRGAAHVQILQQMVERVGGKAPSRFLADIGCGWGRDLLHLSQVAHSVIGVDVSAFSLLIAKKLLEEEGTTNVRLVLAQGEHLPLRSQSVDAMNCSATIEHFPHPEEFLQEASRCLMSGGWLFLYYPNRFSLLPETHTGILGLGWLPRRWQEVVVAKLKHGTWDTTLFSRRGFVRATRGRFPIAGKWVTGMPPGLEDFAETSKFVSMLGRWYALAKAGLIVARHIPGCESLLSAFAPVHFAVLVRQ
jgi:ubiquinone/menaquinone biosynthesis C-methylase UbiE